MRDEKDPGTLELTLPRKRGRPPRYGKAMSAAERMRIYRKANAREVEKFNYHRLADYSDVVLLAALREDIALPYPEGVRCILAELGKRHANL